MAKTKFSIYLEDNLKKELEADAEKEHRTLVGAVAKAVSFYLENKDKIMLERDEFIKTAQPLQLTPLQLTEAQQEQKLEEPEEIIEDEGFGVDLD